MADPVDLVSLAEAKRAINVAATDTSVDTELATLITAVSQRLDDRCGPVVIRTVSSERHDGEGSFVALRRTPASVTSTTTITTVVEWQGTASVPLTAESDATKPSDSYLFDAPTGLLYRRSSGHDRCFHPGRQNVVVTYQTGRYADTASVAPKFRQAANIAIAHIWSNIGAGAGAGRFGADGTVAFGIPPWDIPKAALLLLADELRPDGFA